MTAPKRNIDRDCLVFAAAAVIVLATALAFYAAYGQGTVS